MATSWLVRVLLSGFGSGRHCFLADLGTPTMVGNNNWQFLDGSAGPQAFCFVRLTSNWLLRCDGPRLVRRAVWEIRVSSAVPSNLYGAKLTAVRPFLTTIRSIQSNVVSPVHFLSFLVVLRTRLLVWRFAPRAPAWMDRGPDGWILDCWQVGAHLDSSFIRIKFPTDRPQVFRITTGDGEFGFGARRRFKRQLGFRIRFRWDPLTHPYTLHFSDNRYAKIRGEDPIIEWELTRDTNGDWISSMQNRTRSRFYERMWGLA